MILESYFGASLGLCYSEDAECIRLNVLPQFKRLLKFGVSADFPCIIDTAAELYFLPFQGDEFNLVSSAFRTFGELLRHGMAVGTRTETGGYDNNFFHQIWLLALMRSAKLTFGLR